MFSDTTEDRKLPDAAATRRAARAVSRILVVDEHAGLRNALARLVDREINGGLCVQADSAEQASKAIRNQLVDFVIVNTPAQGPGKSHPAEKIKLHCPGIPILAVSVRQELPSDNITEKRRSQQINPNTAERILAGIKYIRSLSHCGVKGFTIVVKE